MKIKTIKVNLKKLFKKAEKLKSDTTLWSQEKSNILRDVLIENIKDKTKITTIYTSPDIMTILQCVKLDGKPFVTRVEGNMYEYVFHFADFDLTGFIDAGAIKADGTSDNFIMLRFNDGTSKVLNFNSDDLYMKFDETKKSLWQKIKSIFKK